MAKKGSIERMEMIKKRLGNEARQKKREELLSKMRDKNLGLKERMNAREELFNFNSWDRRTTLRRIAIDGKTSGFVLKGVPVARALLRELIINGKIPGVRKYSW